MEETFGAIDVRAGRFTFSIAGPEPDVAQAQLPALAAIVLSRSSHLR